MVSLKNKVVVVIPFYRDCLNEYELISFKRMLHVFKKRDVCIVAPYQIKDYVNLLLEKSDMVLKSCFFSDEYFKSTKGYNKLLMSKQFYENFIDFEFILISQLDVYVFKDDIDYWVDQGYDNIGAPVFEGYTKANYIIKEGFNNGGFCLRKVSSCLKVLSQIKFMYSRLSVLYKMETTLKWRLYRIIRDGFIFNYTFKYLKPIINEDVFWSFVVSNQYPFFRSCESSKSICFAFDAQPKYLFKKNNNKLPMAIHAWWRYDKEFVESLFNNGYE